MEVVEAFINKELVKVNNKMIIVKIHLHQKNVPSPLYVINRNMFIKLLRHYLKYAKSISIDESNVDIYNNNKILPNDYLDNLYNICHNCNHNNKRYIN